VGKHRKPGQSGGTTVRLVLLSIGLMVPGVFGVASAATTDGLVGNLRCVIVDTPCSAVARPERLPQGAQSPVPGPAVPRRPAPADTAGHGGATTEPTGPAPAITFAPFVDMDAWPPVDLAEVAERTGIARFTVGFVSAGQGCSAAWGGAVPLTVRLDGDLVGQRLDRLRDRTGGKAVVSLTGPEGTDLATQCTKVDDLTRQYRAALDAAGGSGIDVFIPAGEAVDATAVERRSKALAQLQWERPGLEVTLTLPLTPAGLRAEALGVLASALANELDVARVNLFGGDLPAAAGGNGAGRALVQAVTRAHDQLRGVYRGESEARLWERIGVTPMIGTGRSGTFGLADARLLRDWARDRRIGLLSMWSVTRDAECDIATDPARNACSGVAQRRGQFMEILGSA
jgi:hypothetical protein